MTRVTKNITRTLSALACLSFLTAVSATAQSNPKATYTPVAYVYVQSTNGVNVFTAGASGTLTLLNGSPFADTGQMEGVNGAYLFSVGTDYLHSYAIASNGAVGKQVSQIDTQNYSGAECGNTAGTSVLDHTGHYFYVHLAGASYNGGEDALCDAWQTYSIASNGQLTFLGDYEPGYTSGPGNSSATSTPTISSNDLFGYGTYQTEFSPVFAPFARDSGNVLSMNPNYTETDPTPQPSQENTNYFPENVTADNNGHLAAAVVESFVYPVPPAQMASYTINSKGGIASTNTWQNMPTLQLSFPLTMRMSPNGQILAVGSEEPGLELFHFNGAAPITLFGGTLLPNNSIDQLGWDNSNHLYALDSAAGALFVYTVTSTSITPVAGSPYNVRIKSGIPSGVKDLIVVPK